MTDTPKQADILIGQNGNVLIQPGFLGRIISNYLHNVWFLVIADLSLRYPSKNAMFIWLLSTTSDIHTYKYGSETTQF